MRPGPRCDLVVADDAHRAVGLEHGEPHVADVGHAVLAEGLLQVLVCDPGALAVLVEGLAVVDEQDSLTRQQFRHAAAPEPPPVDDPVPGDQHTRGHETSGQTRIGADHRVLYRVRDDEEKHEIEGGHLAELSRAGETQRGEQGEVHDGGAEGDVDENRPGSRHAKPPEWVGFMRPEGLEPPRVAPQDPKSCASTNSATVAWFGAST